MMKREGRWMEAHGQLVARYGEFQSFPYLRAVSTKLEPLLLFATTTADDDDDNLSICLSVCLSIFQSILPARLEPASTLR